MALDPKTLPDGLRAKIRLATLAQDQSSKGKPTPRPFNFSHKDLIDACLEVLTAHGVFAWKANTGAASIGKRFVRFGKKGQPDIIGIIPGGQFLAVECKVGKDKLRPEQADFKATIESYHGAFLAQDDCDALIDWLRQMKIGA